MKNIEKMKLSLSHASTAAPIIFFAIKGCTSRLSHLLQPLMCSMKLNLFFLILNRGITLSHPIEPGDGSEAVVL